MQKRFFNTTGYCNPDWHYTINPLRGIGDQIMDLIDNNLYFVIHAPRQSGKTTLLHSLTRKLNKEGKNTALVFSIESAGYRSISVEDANKTIINSIQLAASTFLDKESMPPDTKNYLPANDTFQQYLSDWSRKISRPLVLLIDEIDSLYDDVLISLLRQLRNGFQLRPKNFPASIALIGLRDVRDYKERIRENEKSIGSGSPFNIKAESFSLKNFSKDEIAGLYQQYTDETGQAFPDEVIDQVVGYTNGQPWLTNAIAREITEKILKKDYSAVITPEIAHQAKENLILRRDTHLDSLMDKLSESRVKPIISSIISGTSQQSDSYNNDLQYCIDLGIVSETSSGIKISNKIYSEIIPRVLNKQVQDEMTAMISPFPFIKDGKLQMDYLLKEFQQFYRENAESWMERFSYKEAGHQLLLMAFLQRILNGGGQINREMAVGRGRTDLVIDFGGERFVLELKLKNQNYKKERALEQISAYMDTLSQEHGYLVLFESKPSKIISWEERIKWEEIEHVSLGINRKIVVIEM
jgi:hypothetical protein